LSGAEAALSLDVAQGVAVIALARPARRNALRLEDLGRLQALLTQCARRDDVRVVVVGSAAEGMFCAGLDLGEVRTCSADAARAGRLYDAMDAAFRTLGALSAVTVAAIDGAAVGAGCALAFACDYRWVSPRASFAVPAARLGLVYPCADVQRLGRAVGPSTATRMLATGEALDAARAVGLGAAVGVCDAPMRAALDDARLISAAAPGGVAAMTRTLRSSFPVDQTDRKAFVKCATSDMVRANLR
jgi:enoyl-CoA hydratase/carnithine racemase